MLFCVNKNSWFSLIAFFVLCFWSFKGHWPKFLVDNRNIFSYFGRKILKKFCLFLNAIQNLSPCNRENNFKIFGIAKKITKSDIWFKSLKEKLNSGFWYLQTIFVFLGILYKFVQIFDFHKENLFCLPFFIFKSLCLLIDTLIYNSSYIIFYSAHAKTSLICELCFTNKKIPVARIERNDYNS